MGRTLRCRSTAWVVFRASIRRRIGSLITPVPGPALRGVRVVSSLAGAAWRTCSRRTQALASRARVNLSTKIVASAVDGIGACGLMQGTTHGYEGRPPWWAQRDASTVRSSSAVRQGGPHTEFANKQMCDPSTYAETILGIGADARVRRRGGGHSAPGRRKVCRRAAGPRLHVLPQLPQPRRASLAKNADRPPIEVDVVHHKASASLIRTPVAISSSATGR